MSLEDNIQRIRNFLLDRYKNNLAAILIFGSANTNHFVGGKSDIDHMIFLKTLGGIDTSEEIKLLFDKLKSENFASQYFNSLKGVKDYIKKRKSFSTYITIVSKDGSRTVYTTPEFERTREYLRKHPFTRKEIQEQIQEKDKFELDGYFREINDYNLTKALMSHLRRKLQVINYFKTGKLVFDYESCLKGISLVKNEREELERLYNLYQKRKSLSKKDVKYYGGLAQKFTERIIQ